MKRLYALLLYLFPRAYREEYGKELQAVFNLSLHDAIKTGRIESARVVLQELISLPKAVLYEHLRERRKANMIRKFDSYFDFSHGSWKEFLTALMPFFVAGAMPSLNYLIRLDVIPASGLLGTGIPLALLGLFIILLVVGVKKEMPRWSLPYFGFVLSLLSVYFFSFLFGTPIYFLFRNYRDSSLLLVDILWAGIFWYGLLTAMVLAVAAIRVSPSLQRFRNDWTLLCFILYGAAPFGLLLTFDEYVGDEPYTLLTFLVLAGGAWFYLRSKSEWKRFGLLFGALTLAMLIATTAKLILIPSQDWANPLDTSLINSDAKHTLLMWVWFAIGMLIPLGIKLLPRSDVSIQVSPSEG